MGRRQYRVFIVSLISVFALGLIPSSQARAEEHSHSGSQSAATLSSHQKSDDSDIETLKKAVKEGPVDSGWWEKAESLLDRLSGEEAKKFLESLDDGDASGNLKELIQARFVSSPSDLERNVKSESEVKTKASQVEWDRREKKDPNVKLISDLFDMRRAGAMVHEDTIRKGIESEDDAAVAKDISTLYYVLSDSQKKDVVEKLKQEVEKDEVKKDPKRLRFVQRLLWTGEEITGGQRDNSSVSNGFKDKVSTASDQALNRAMDFNRKLDRANQGDEQARKWIHDNYDDNALIDYMAHNKDNDMGVKMAKFLGWKDKDGVTHLDVATKGSGSSASPKFQTWTLGKTDADIKNALNAFDNTVVGSPANTAKQFQHVALNHDPSNLAQRNFVKVEGADNHLAAYKPHILMPEDEKQVCTPSDPNPPTSMVTNRVPHYFFRPFPYSDMGSYASTDGQDDHNYVLDLKSGKEIMIPGSYDPVPTPDEMYMTIPSDDASDAKKGLTFFSMKRLLSGDQAPLFVDTQMQGVYQSIGMLPSDPMSPTYRVITDMSGTVPDPTGKNKDGLEYHLSYRDYKVTKQPGLDGQVQPQGDAPHPLCVGLKLALPMLSKDGKQVAALDIDAQVTKIYDIESDGTCKEALNLGIYTGKVDFNYDNDLIAFHKYNNEDKRKDYIKVPSDELAGNIYVYKRSTGEISRLSRNTDSNAVYPAFRRDGKLVYLQHPKREGNEKAPSRLVVVDPKTASSHSFDFFPAGKPHDAKQEEKMHATIGLGALWSQLCSPNGNDVSAETAALSSLNVPAESCKLMVDKYWDTMKDQVVNTKRFQTDKRVNIADLKALTKEKLLEACAKPDQNSEIQGPTGNRGNQNPNQTHASDLPAVIQDNCLHCHAIGTIPWGSPQELQSGKSRFRNMIWSKDIIDRINLPESDPNHMPKEGTLTPDQKQQLIDYLTGN